MYLLQEMCICFFAEMKKICIFVTKETVIGIINFKRFVYILKKRR